MNQALIDAEDDEGTDELTGGSDSEYFELRISGSIQDAKKLHATAIADYLKDMPGEVHPDELAEIFGNAADPNIYMCIRHLFDKLPEDADFGIEINDSTCELY